MSPNYKLTYFDARGRAELIRYIFVVSGQKYEDERLDSTAWQTLKPKTPFGQMPILHVDGKQLCQTNSISRYLAKQFGLAGKDALEEARVDSIVDCVEDILRPLSTLIMEKDEVRKTEIKKKYEEQRLDMYAKMEALLKTNTGGAEGFFVGKTFTWADLAVCRGLDSSELHCSPPVLDKFPALLAHKKLVESTPKLAEWIQVRPKTQF